MRDSDKYQKRSKMAKVIAISSGKGGVGKTISAINLGIALNELGKNVIVVDGSLSTPDVAVYLGAPSIPVGFGHVLAGKAHIHDAIYSHKSGTKIVPGSIALSQLATKEHGERFHKAINHLRHHADFVIVDCSAGLNTETIMALKACDEVLIATNPELPAITNALKATRLAQKLKKKVAGAIITRIRHDNLELALRNVKTILEIPILAKVPEDDSVRQSVNLRKAVVLSSPKSKASQSYMKLASKLARNDYSDELSFFERVFGWFRR